MMMRPSNVTVGLWDGDSLIWRFGWGTDRDQCCQFLDTFVAECHGADLGIQTSKFYIGDEDKTNFRYKVLPDYKANRVGKGRPENEQALREHLIKNYGAIVVRGAEADDALGIEQCRTEGSIIFSNDKDLDMIPGWHYDTDFRRHVGGAVRKAYKEAQIYSVTDPGSLKLKILNEGLRNQSKVLCGTGHLWFCAQLLLGDTADNIPSLSKLSGKRMGPVTVYNHLKDCVTYEDALRTCYKLYVDNIKLDKDEVVRLFKVNSKLLWIKRRQGKEIIYPEEWLS